MLTLEDLERFDVFTGLGPVDCKRITRLAGDVRLNEGDYAAHVGEEPALFGLLEGLIEVVVTLDGEERVLGYRRPGEVFGEISITLSIRQPASYRASKPSRFFRLDPDAYHTLVANAPTVEARVREKASHRVGGPSGMQAVVAAAAKARAFVLGHRSDAACAELRHFLDSNQIRFTWLQPDVPEDAARWPGALPVEGDLPALCTVNGKTVVRPRLRRAAELLDIATEPAATQYDTVIVGAGPAGLAAAVYGASEGLKTIAIERHSPGGQAGTSSRIENYLGFPAGVSGADLSSRALQQAHRLGAEVIVTRTVTRIDPETRQIHLDGGDVLQSRTIILASGVAWRRLAIDGGDDLVGKGIFYGAARSEATNSQGLDVQIVGAGNSAGQAAMFFSAHARSVTIVHRGETLEKSMSRYLIDQIARRANIRVLFNTQVTAAHGDTALREIELLDTATNQTTRVESGGLFIFIGANPKTEWLPPEIALDHKRFVVTGSDVRATGRWHLERDPYLLETSVPGIFACGDVRCSPVKRVAAAVGEGSMAIAFVHQYLKEADQRSTRDTPDSG